MLDPVQGSRRTEFNSKHLFVCLFIYFGSGVRSDWICSSQSGVMWPPRVHLAMSVDTFWVSRLGRHSWDLVGARDTASILQSTGCPLPPQGQGSSSPNSTCVEWRKLWFCWVINLCPTLCDPKDCGKPGSTVLHYLPGLAQVLVHWVRDAILPSHPLLPSCPFAFYLAQHQSLFQWVSSSHQVAKVLDSERQN